jgi:hypothetical protein
MRRETWAWTAVVLLASCTPGDGKIRPPKDLIEASDAVDLAAEIPDVPADDPGIPDVAPDVPADPGLPEPAPDAAVDVAEPFADAADPGGPETAQDPGTDPGPILPFAPCDNQTPCKDAVQGLCLLFPKQDKGVCVQSCETGATNQCPPWQECVVVDAQNKKGACFSLALYGEPCGSATGILCDASRAEYCLDPSGATNQGRCTRFCDPLKPSCPYWQECKKIGDSGACFDRAPPDPCVEGKCAAGKVCASGVCAQSCTADTQCGLLERCRPSGSEQACQPDPSPIGSPCLAEFGIACRDGLACEPGTGGLPGFCTRLCAKTADCPVFMSCLESRCVRADRVDPGARACSPFYACEDPGRVCTDTGAGLSLCLAPCKDGACTGGASCVAGGCAFRAGQGEVCGPDRGLLCQDGLTCRVDGAKDPHFGFCTLACTDACDNGLSCVGGWCGSTSKYGDECSDVGGRFCETGSECLLLDSALRRGICSKTCKSVADCEPPFAGANASCLFPSSTGTKCGLLCGDFGGKCPDYLTCNDMGFCLF